MYTTMELTRECGLEKWSIRDLAQRLGVVPSVIYHHYQNRDAITGPWSANSHPKLISNYHGYLGVTICVAGYARVSTDDADQANSSSPS